VLVRELLVIEVVQESHDSPGLFVAAVFARRGAHDCLNRPAVAPQLIGLCEFAEEFPCLFAIHLVASASLR